MAPVASADADAEVADSTSAYGIFARAEVTYAGADASTAGAGGVDTTTADGVCDGRAAGCCSGGVTPITEQRTANTAGSSPLPPPQ